MINRIAIPNWMKCEVIKRNILEYGDFTCEYCFQTLGSREIEFDHMDPIDRGGETVLSNLAIACYKCNGKKGNKDYHTFIKSIKNFVRLSDRAHLKYLGFFERRSYV